MAQTKTITKSSIIGTTATADAITKTSTRMAPAMVQARSAAPAVRVRGMHINAPPATCTIPVNMAGEVTAKVLSKA